MANKIETLIPYDKALHIIGGAVIFAAFHWRFGMFAIVPVVIAAIAKEIYDKFHPESHTCDIKDAIATVIGGLICLIGAL